MRRRITIAIFFCVVFLSENVSANEIIGLVLDFPPSALDSVTKVELAINTAPDIYTNMNCNRNDPDDICPGYKDIPNYIQYIDPTYDGPALPGALGLDWQRTEWTPTSKKITYMGGTDTLQSGILDGYVYQDRPAVADVVLFGYPGKTKWSYFDTGEDVWILVWIFYEKFDVWAILLEDDWDVADAILVTQIMAGMNPAIPADGPYDVNADGKIGLQEEVYILQKIAGLRSLEERF